MAEFDRQTGEPAPEELLAYCRARQFPPAETVARKFSEIAGRRFPWTSLAEAPPPARRFFEIYAGMVKLLDPYLDENAAPLPSIDGEPVALDASMEILAALLDDDDGPLEYLAKIIATPTDDLAHKLLGCSLIEAANIQLIAARVAAPFIMEKSDAEPDQHSGAGAAAAKDPGVPKDPGDEKPAGDAAEQDQGADGKAGAEKPAAASSPKSGHGDRQDSPENKPQEKPEVKKPAAKARAKSKKAATK
ncbi:hypothetical protein [Oricola cellulosilytica]|uniref:Uncharacterized protein n=1 Tax=Oricola cellulosilytica TaxID=1429082 RepID=A0A4R0PEU1_9HYPH|nr:hypothetical protein [Oricola cellulosilytica]TCD15158.1 hypothetical protein E0D97_06310 [Oricola cellulosilytica]